MPILFPIPAASDSGTLLPSSQLMHLDVRVDASERANRALLDEITRVQSDVKSLARKMETAVNDTRADLSHVR